MNRFVACCLGAAFFAAGNSLFAVEYRFVNIADNTTTAPIGLFNDFGVPSISGDVVAFRAAYHNYPDTDSGSGIFTGSGQSLQTIVKTGDAAPSGIFGSISNDPTISGELVAFQSSYAGTSGVFAGSGGPLTLIASPGDTTPRGTVSRELGDPAISNGTAAFRNSYTSDKKGIVSGSGGPLTPIVTTGDPAPIGTFGFFHVGHPAISEENVAFLGGGGISVGNGGPLTTIVKLGDPAPEGVFTGFGDPSIDGEVVAFGATYAGRTGIFTGTGGALTTIVQSGDTAPAGTFSGVSTPSISGNEMAFFGAYGQFGPRGIFVHNAGSVTSVITTGDTLFGEIVTRLDFGRFGLDSDGSGRVAFRYYSGDGRVGIGMAIPVPEASTIALLSLGASFASFARLGARRRRVVP
jgi:hypothetical protein